MKMKLFKTTKRNLSEAEKKEFEIVKKLAIPVAACMVLAIVLFLKLDETIIVYGIIALCMATFIFNAGRFVECLTQNEKKGE